MHIIALSGFTMQPHDQPTTVWARGLVGVRVMHVLWVSSSRYPATVALAYMRAHTHTHTCVWPLSGWHARPSPAALGPSSSTRGSRARARTGTGKTWLLMQTCLPGVGPQLAAPTAPLLLHTFPPLSLPSHHVHAAGEHGHCCVLTARRGRAQQQVHVCTCICEAWCSLLGIGRRTW